MTEVFTSEHIFLLWNIKFSMREKFIKSTLILLVGGAITKVLGMLIKIITNRLIGPEGIGLYMLILPTFILFISVSQLGMPTALVKMIAEDKKNNRNLFFSIVPIVLLFNLFLIIVILLGANFLSLRLLHNKDAVVAILAIALVIPFTSISSICRSYFLGKEMMWPHIISNIVEDIVRLTLIICFTPFFLRKGTKYAVCFLVLCNVISETASILILFLFLPKNLRIKRSDFKPNKIYIKECLDIGLPNTTGRFISSIGYFLEPIILTNSLLLCGYNKDFIIREYGILSGYAMPLILLPSFFTMAISQALLPVIAKKYSDREISSVRSKIKQAIFFSLIIGLVWTIILFNGNEILLKFIYNTNLGGSYIKFLGPVCLLQYIQAPLSAVLDAMGESKNIMMSAILGVIVRSILTFVLAFLHIGIWGLIMAISANILVVTFYQASRVRKHLKEKELYI